MPAVTNKIEQVRAQIDRHALDMREVVFAGVAVLRPDIRLEDLWSALSRQLSQKSWRTERILWHWRAPALVDNEMVETHWLGMTPFQSGISSQLAGLLKASKMTWEECSDHEIDPGGRPVLKWNPSEALVVRLWPRSHSLPELRSGVSDNDVVLHRHYQMSWDDRTRPPTAYFLRLALENIRCFKGEQTVSCLDADGRLAQWTLLLGENGVGKTTALQCFAWMRPEVKFGPDGEGVQAHLSGWENSEIRALAGDASAGSFALRCDIAYHAKLGEAPQHTIYTSAKARIIGDELSNEGTEVDGGSKGQCPDIPIIYYGAGRAIEWNNLGEQRLEDPLASIGNGRTELYDPEEVLREFDAEATKSTGAGGRKARAMLCRILQILVELLPDVAEPSDIDIGRPGILGPGESPPGILFRTPYGRVPLQALSFGYQMVLTWTLDLMRRLVRIYRGHPDPLSAPAVVLVDEVDLHLHPRWQREIGATLRRTFPAVQFIVTAHSPLMAQEAEDENIEVFRQEGGMVHVLSNPHIRWGARLDQIMTSEVYGLPARSSAAAALIDRRRALYQKRTRSEEEEAELARLDEVFAQLPDAERPEDQQVIDRLHRALAILEPRASSST